MSGVAFVFLSVQVGEGAESETEKTKLQRCLFMNLFIYLLFFVGCCCLVFLLL